MGWVSNLVETWKENARIWNEQKNEPIQKHHKREEKKVDSLVQEPILAFVRTVKANPSRFRCRASTIVDEYLVKYPWTDTHYSRHFTVKDRKEGFEFQAIYVPSMDKLYDVLGTGFSLNHWELKYLHEELYPIFYRGMERLLARQIRREQRNKKAERDAKEAADNAKREEWKEVYK